MNDLTFGRPELWPALLALPVLWALLWALLDRRRAAVRRYGALPVGTVPSPLGRSALLSLLAGLAVVCWMDPRLGEEQVTVERRGLDLIFCLDTSRSMLARDLEPTRFARAKQDVLAVLPDLEGGDRTALIAFAGAARTWVPLTHDLDSFRGLLADVDTTAVATGGTDVAAALRKAKEIADPEAARTTVVVLLTDGEDLAGAGRQAAGELAAAGITVHAVGYGSALGSKITVAEDGKEDFLRARDGTEVVSRMDAESLRGVASACGGEFVRADAMALPLRELHQKRIVAMQKRAYESGEQRAGKARYQWVLLPLLVLAAFELATASGRSR